MDNDTSIPSLLQQLQSSNEAPLDVLLTNCVESIPLLCDGLKTTSRFIRSLQFLSGRIGASSLGMIVDSLLLNEEHCCSQLQRLCFNSQMMGAAGAAHVARLLPHLPCLIDLRLGDNGIGDEGVTLLADSLRSSERLLVIGLQENDISIVGLRILCGCLPPMVSSVILGGNSFGDEGDSFFLKFAVVETAPQIQDVWFSLATYFRGFGIGEGEEELWTRDKGVGLNFLRRNPLHLASVIGDVEFARVLIDEKNAEPNTLAQEMGETALHVAVRNGHFSVAEFLITHGGANPSVKNSCGQEAVDLIPTAEPQRTEFKHLLGLANMGSESAKKRKTMEISPPPS